MWLSLAFVAWVATNFYLAYDTLPFFPIEISWTLSATEKNVLLNGIVLCLFPFVLFQVLVLPWFFYLWITIAFGGVMVGDHLGLWHNVMVKHLLLTLLALVYQLHGLNVLGGFLVFYFVRPVTKFYLIATAIQKQSLADWIYSPWQTFKGAYAYAVQPKNSGHPVLKMGGVWQWVVWGSLIWLIETPHVF